MFLFELLDGLADQVDHFSVGGAALVLRDIVQFIVKLAVNAQPMEILGKAYFVSDPRRIEDLTVLHLVEKERPFEVVRIVKLAKIDYENFITDMVADRQFIEDHAALCSKGEVWRCILVQQCGHTDGVLVMPEDGCFVGWAAYYQE